MKDKFMKFARNMHVEPFRSMWLIIIGMHMGLLLTLAIGAFVK